MKKTGLNLSFSLIFVSFFALAFLSGCEYDFVEPENTPIPDEISFATDIMPIFNASCNMSGCHAAGAFAPDLSAGNAFSALNNGFIDATTPENSLIYTAMATGSMKSFTTVSEANLVLAWIKKGALNN